MRHLSRRRNNTNFYRRFFAFMGKPIVEKTTLGTFNITTRVLGMVFSLFRFTLAYFSIFPTRVVLKTNFSLTVNDTKKRNSRTVLRIYNNLGERIVGKSNVQ